MTDRDLLDDQIAYYRARAAEYDATSMPPGDPNATHIDALRSALRAFEPRGRVIELAAGTGQWTGELAEFADDLLVTDSSPEMLDLNRARLGERPAVRHAVLDAFALPPSGDFDVAFLGFFLSHVPPSRFATFWSLLEGILRPMGRVFFIDERRHGLWDEDWIDQAEGVVRRPLSDGTVHRAVKVLWEPDELAARLQGLGWDASVQAVGPFYWGTAVR
ncbi:MAG TPA: class I SAM-dependent methyltransferase [Candidatus Limnocylindria bacterium]